MKKGKLWAIVVLCSFFTQQIFAFSWETIGTNMQVGELEENIEVIEIMIDEEITPVIEEVIIEEEWWEESNWENFWSWNTLEDNDAEDWNAEILNTEEVIIEVETSNETWTWVQDEIIIDNSDEEEFDFWIKFQNPSYILDKDLEKTEYICDFEKEECKVNIVYINEIWENLSSDYECITEYSQWFENDNRCNPTTIIFTETTQVSYIVYLKNNPENKRQKSLNFIVENYIWEEGSDEDTWDGNNLWEDFWEEEVSEEGSDSTGNNSDNNTGTWEIIILENDSTETWSGNMSGSWIIVEDNQNTGENVDIDEQKVLPEIFLEIQSGLEYSGTWNIYVCEKQDCKINLDISESFTWSFLESDFNCEWNFWSGSFSTQNTDKKCNPGYVNYGSGIHEIFVKIIDVNDVLNFTWTTFQVQNMISQDDNIEEVEEVEESEDEEEALVNNKNTWTGTTWTWVINTEWSTNTWSEMGTGDIISEIFLFPEIKINIQSWADYLDADNIECSKEDCKINLDISEIFTEDFLENKYSCLWDFGNGSFSSYDTINKCNPWYVDYDIWEDIIAIKLSEKENPENFIEKNIFLHNNKTIKQSAWNRWWNSWNNSSNQTKKDYWKITENKNILIQSGLENNICNEEKCKINLDYDNASYESCKWNFWNIEVTEKYKTTCNPWFIYADSGVFKISLEVYNNKTNKNYSKILIFSNNYIEEFSQEEIYFDIILQWKSVDYKKYYNDKIICLWVDRCSINLDLDTNYKENLNYKWDFWNWEISDSKNPKSVWFWTGSYQVNLDINWENISEIKKINIEVTWKSISVEQQNIMEEFKFEEQKENSLFTQLKKVNFNNIELWLNDKKNILNQDIYEKSINKIKKLWWFKDNSHLDKKLKLTRNISQHKKSLKYSWVTFPNSDIYILQWDEIIELSSDNTGKYSEKFTDITAWDYILEYYVLDSRWNLFENKKEKLLSLSNEYVKNIEENNFNLSKNKQNKVKKISNKTIDKVKQKNIDNTQYASILPEITMKTTTWEYIFQLLLLLLSVTWGSILLRKYKIL